MGLFRKRKKNTQAINRQLPEYWKFEIFYYNKQDKSILVSSRFGVGFALNYGHKAVQVATAIVVAVALAAIVLLFVL